MPGPLLFWVSAEVLPDAEGVLWRVRKEYRDSSAAPQNDGSERLRAMVKIAVIARIA
jgi:hypothetical protein